MALHMSHSEAVDDVLHTTVTALAFTIGNTLQACTAKTKVQAGPSTVVVSSIAVQLYSPTHSCHVERSSHERMEEDIEQTMDRFFGGVLRSDVVCACCGYTSNAHDPFKEISVDILEHPTPRVQPPAVDVHKPNPVSASKGSKSAGKAAHGRQHAARPQCSDCNLSGGHGT